MQFGRIWFDVTCVKTGKPGKKGAELQGGAGAGHFLLTSLPGWAEVRKGG